MFEFRYRDSWNESTVADNKRPPDRPTEKTNLTWHSIIGATRYGFFVLLGVKSNTYTSDSRDWKSGSDNKTNILLADVSESESAHGSSIIPADLHRCPIIVLHEKFKSQETAVGIIVEFFSRLNLLIKNSARRYNSSA